MITTSETRPAQRRVLPISPGRLGGRIARVPPSYFVVVALLITIWIHRPNQLDITIMGVFVRNVAPLGIVVLGQLLVMRVRSIDLSGAGVLLLVNYYFASGAFGGAAPGVVAVFALSPSSTTCTSGLPPCRSVREKSAGTTSSARICPRSMSADTSSGACTTFCTLK